MPRKVQGRNNQQCHFESGLSTSAARPSPRCLWQAAWVISSPITRRSRCFQRCNKRIIPCPQPRMCSQLRRCMCSLFRFSKKGCFVDRILTLLCLRGAVYRCAVQSLCIKRPTYDVFEQSNNMLLCESRIRLDMRDASPHIENCFLLAVCLLGLLEVVVFVSWVRLDMREITSRRTAGTASTAGTAGAAGTAFGFCAVWLSAAHRWKCFNVWLFLGRITRETVSRTSRRAWV